MNVNLEYAFDVDTVEEAMVAAENVELPGAYVSGSFELMEILDGNQTITQKSGVEL